MKIYNKPLFFTFYTNDMYLADARRLEQCCNYFGLKIEIVKGEEFGSWKKNCNQKPRLIEQVRNRVEGPIVWLDSDCIIHSEPIALLEKISGDALLWQGGLTEKHYVSSQTMLWNDTKTSRSMIADWAALSRENPESLADPLLKIVCENWRSRASIGRLPDMYLKPYWKVVEGVSSENIIISTNERRCVHPDAAPRQNRVRLDPLKIPYVKPTEIINE